MSRKRPVIDADAIARIAVEHAALSERDQHALLYGVLCPRCRDHSVRYQRRGGYVSFCIRQLAFLLPNEFTAVELSILRDAPL